MAKICGLLHLVIHLPLIKVVAGCRLHHMKEEMDECAALSSKQWLWISAVKKVEADMKIKTRQSAMRGGSRVYRRRWLGDCFHAIYWRRASAAAANTFCSCCKLQDFKSRCCWRLLGSNLHILTPLVSPCYGCEWELYLVITVEIQIRSVAGG